jgi:hypothetical protein
MKRRLSFTGIATLTSFLLVSAGAHSEVLPAPRSQYLPAVAANGELYLVVWADERESRQNESDIFGARVTADGRVLDPNGIRICSLSGIQSYPAVASDGRDFLVVWQDDRDERSTESDIYGARVTVQGVVLDPNGFRISGAIHPQYAPSVAFNGRHYLVAWYDYRATSDITRSDIYGARVSGDGAVLDADGIAICIADDLQIGPGVASTGGDFFVTWLDSRRTSQMAGSVRGTRVSAAGAVSDPDGLLLSPNSGRPRVAGNGAGYLAVWSDSRADSPSDDVFAHRVSPGGDPDGTDMLLCNAANGQDFPAVAASGNQFLALWLDGRFGYTNSTVFGARVNADGVLDPNGFPIGRAASQNAWHAPAAASLNGEYLVAWVGGHPGSEGVDGLTDIVAARVNASGTVLDATAFLVSTVAAPVIDSDGDGVPDERDLCPNTRPGDVVDASGCSAEQRDTDSDGVPDAFDLCPNTLPGAIVDAHGCSLAQLCPCDGPWRNHGEYVTCVINLSWDFFRQGLITDDQRRHATHDAVLSDCGKTQNPGKR